jgi:membrane complex biogenesis BtpA family protein
MRLIEMFGVSKPVIGMLHVPALPGSPCSRLSFSQVRDWVLRDAEALQRGGADGAILENFGDTPFYPKRVPAHTIAYLAVLAVEVKRIWNAPLGINVLRNDGIAAIAAASAAQAQFVRVNVYTGARLADQGILEGEAHRIQRYSGMLGKAPHEAAIRVFADVAVKHSAPLAAREIGEEVEETLERGMADAVIVSGAGTGKRTPIEHLRAARRAAHDRPVLVGSGAVVEDLPALLESADGLIAGTALKVGGITNGRVDAAAVASFVDRVRLLR